MSEQPLETPSGIARELFRAIAEERWTDAATFIDPEDVRSRYDLASRILRGEELKIILHQAHSAWPNNRRRWPFAATA